MKVSHEVPRCLLTASPEFNQYDYALPHLFDQDEEYLQYFKDAKKAGRYIIMDNSLHELGEAYNHDRLKHWIYELEPNETFEEDKDMLPLKYNIFRYCLHKGVLSVYAVG